jgi:hypothetical protein
MTELHVASPRACNTQQQAPDSATAPAATVQRNVSKSASLLELARNRLRNSHATQAAKPVQHQGLKHGSSVASVAELGHLIATAAVRYECPEDERRLMNETAARDPATALECFTSIISGIFVSSVVEGVVTDAGKPADDRITCTSCGCLKSGRCTSSAFVHGQDYRPDTTLPRRCEGHLPRDGDADQRSAPERWPGLSG